MAGAGALVTAAVTLVASGAFGWAAWMTRRHRGAAGRAVVSFFVIATLFLALAGTRQVFAYLSTRSDTWIEWDRNTFYLLVVPAAYNTLPLVHLTSLAYGWPARLRRALVLFFALAATAGLAFVYRDGLEGPKVSEWGTEWSIVSPVSGILILLVLTLPAVVFSLLLLRASRRLAGLDRKRLARVSVAFLAYYLVFTADAFAAPGPALLAERLVTAATGVVAASAYRLPPAQPSGPEASQPPAASEPGGPPTENPPAGAASEAIAERLRQLL